MKEEKKKYYYYKKKRGRKKKRGPKPKPKKRGRNWQDTWEFKIVTSKARKQKNYIGKYHTLTEVLQAKEKIEEYNNNVKFPVKYIQSSNYLNAYKEYDSEYLILKRKDENMITTTSQLRNEYGKIINIESSSDIWYIYDRIPLLIEETFWVYGYNPRTDRKKYEWIFNNLIKNVTSLSRIYVMNNKVIFKYDDEIEFVLCKNQSDSIRLYNKLKDDSEKIKTSLFCGKIKRNTFQMKEMLATLKDKTGWTIRKLYKNSTL